MSSTWYNTPTVLRFDPEPDPGPHVGWYRFLAPPGVRSLRFAAQGAPRLWVDGTLVPCLRDTVPSPRFPTPGVAVWRAELPAPVKHAAIVAMRVEQEHGCYAGAVFPEPVTFQCDTGSIALRDLAEDRALGTYSGGLSYSREIVLTRTQAASRKITLDLGALVSSARVMVNGAPAGERPAPPWQFDLTRKLAAGPNRIEVIVHTTLGNHYHAVPSLYAGSKSAGLIGPVVLRIGE